MAVTYKTITFFENQPLPALGGTTSVSQAVKGYNYANIFVEHTQTNVNELPVHLALIFGLGSNDELSARNFYNFEENSVNVQMANPLVLSGALSYQGDPAHKSSFIARVPVVGPYLKVNVINQHSAARTVSVKAYLTK